MPDTIYAVSGLTKTYGAVWRGLSGAQWGDLKPPRYWWLRGVTTIARALPKSDTDCVALGCQLLSKDCGCGPALAMPETAMNATSTEAAMRLFVIIVSLPCYVGLIYGS